MNTAPPERRSRPRKRSSRLLVAGSLLLSIIMLSTVLQLRTASADPATGVGPITVSQNGHWFEYSGNGEPYFMAGSGGPEGFLYYSDSRKQQIVDQLINNDVRAIYIHAVRSNGGDGGGDENPFVDNDPNKGVDPSVLDEWDSYLSQLDAAGIVTWFHLYDDGARPFGACNPDLPGAEKDFVQTVVERFRDYQHLVWLPTEEHIIKACNNNDTDVEKAKALAAEIRIHDQVHPLGVHHNNGQSNQYLGNSDIDVFSQQVCQQSRFTSVDGIHEAGEFGEDVYVMAECHPWHKELLNAGQRTTLRQSFWSSVMAGGYVLFYDAWESNDPSAGMLADLGRINAFMDTTRFAETVPADQLAAAGTKWVLGNESEDVYIAYSNDNPSAMGVQGISAGTYELGWFDPVTGTSVEQTVAVPEGTATFPVPSEIGSEVALSIEPGEGTPQPTPTPEPTPEPTPDPEPTPIPPTPTPDPEPTPTPPTPTPDPEPTPTPPTPTPDPEPTPIPPTPTPEPTPTTNPGATIELGAAEDAYLQGATAVDNDQLRVETGSRERTSYVRFDTSSVENSSGVRLRLTVGSDSGDGTLSVFAGGDGDWTAGTLTPANAPVGEVLLATAEGPFSSGQEVEFVLPVDVISANPLDLVITTDGTGGDDVSFDSSEAGDGPTLVVDSSSTSPTPEPTPDPTPGPSSTVELTATQDAYVQGGNTFDNSQLRAQSGSPTRISYVRFDTAALGGATSVRFELVVGSDAGEGTISVWRGSDGEWTSGTLTPANAPNPVEVLSTASGLFTPGQLLEFSLPTDAVAGDVLDLVIAHDGEGADDVSFQSTETGEGPALVVQVGTIPEPTPTAPPTPEPTPTAPPTPEPTPTAPPTPEPTPTAPPTPEPTPTDPTTETVTFDATSAAIANPERGFHEGASVVDSTGGSTSSVSAMTSDYNNGIRLARMYVRLDDYRNGPIPQSQLDELDEVFANARAAGIKLIPRFTYNFGRAADATVTRIEQHIDQLTPTLQSNADVIALLQAGFIGAWGEWHSSSNGLTNPSDRARVREALLNALPANRMVQFRYPDDIIEFESTPLSASAAWSGGDASRTGHKNDCFLANEHDAGTYIPLSRKPEFVQYLSTMTEFTVMGGETCQVSAGDQRTDCATALAELEQFHWDYLNLGFYGATIDKWQSDGCFDEIDARLGYRFEMQTATAPTEVGPGQGLALALELSNVGFGKLYNPRPVNVVLVDDATGLITRIEAVADARTVMPLPGDTTTIDLGVTVPSGMESGAYQIHVELPDGSASLAGDARYSIQMANADTWQGVDGTNDLGLEVLVG